MIMLVEITKKIIGKYQGDHENIILGEIIEQNFKKSLVTTKH